MTYRDLLEYLSSFSERDLDKVAQVLIVDQVIPVYLDSRLRLPGLALARRWSNGRARRPRMKSPGAAEERSWNPQNRRRVRRWYWYCAEDSQG
jgi:hypothetical protein